VISGSFAQVVEAFDLLSDLLYSNHMHSTPSEPFTFHVMIDHAKAGRVVGPKVGTMLPVSLTSSSSSRQGSNIQALKSRSGATQVRVVKDPEVGPDCPISSPPVSFFCFLFRLRPYLRLSSASPSTPSALGCSLNSSPLASLGRT
jgi:hypothetical protein